MTDEPPDQNDDETTERDAVADERDQVADDREAALEARESRVEAMLASQADRDTNARKILDEADQRDEVSDARDADANDREVAASRAEFLDQKDNSQHQPAVRRAAALDREHSKSDRKKAGTDRVELAGEDATVADEPAIDD